MQSIMLNTMILLSNALGRIYKARNHISIADQFSSQLKPQNFILIYSIGLASDVLQSDSVMHVLSCFGHV